MLRRRVVLVAVAGAALVGAVSALAIIGGADAPRDRYPWLAQLRSDDSFCTGSLVHPEWVVTAAHCVTEEKSLRQTPRTLVEVRVGSDALDEGGELRSVKQVIRYPGYMLSGGLKSSDLALVRLVKPVSLAPVALAAPGRALHAANQAFIAGWGSAERPLIGLGHAEKPLRNALVYVRSSSFCARKWTEEHFDAETQLCSTESSGEACHGDSGGPLFVDRGYPASELLGVIIAGDPHCRQGHVNVYTRLVDGPLRAWLSAQMRPAGQLALRRCPDAPLLPGLQSGEPGADATIAAIRSTIDCGAAIELAREVLGRDDCVEETRDSQNTCRTLAFDCVSTLQPRFGVLFAVVCDAGKDRVAFRQATPPLRLEGPIDFTGLAPVRVGMSKADAEAATGLHFLGSRILGECGELRPSPGMGDATEADYLPGASMMLIGPSRGDLLLHGHIARVDIFEPGYTTVGGLGIGSTEAEVLGEYGGLVAVSPHHYGDGRYLTVRSPDPNLRRYRIVFETEEGRVSWIRAGRLPEVGYVEHCL